MNHCLVMLMMSLISFFLINAGKNASMKKTLMGVCILDKVDKVGGLSHFNQISHDYKRTISNSCQKAGASETISLKFVLNGGLYLCDVQSILNASLTFQMDLNWISSIINLKSGNLDQKNVLMQNTLSVILIYIPVSLCLWTLKLLPLGTNPWWALTNHKRALEQPMRSWAGWCHQRTESVSRAG